jgi:hypothetical protein
MPGVLHERVAPRERAAASPPLVVVLGESLAESRNESPDAMLRRELLNLDPLTGVPEAKVLFEVWRVEYNQARPCRPRGADRRATVVETAAPRAPS